MTAPLFPLHQAQKLPVPVSARSTTIFNTNNRLIQGIKKCLVGYNGERHIVSQLTQAWTVLITSVPQTLDSEHKIRQFVSFVPGGIDRIWLYYNIWELNKLYEKWEDACEMLEKAVTEVLKLASREYCRLHKKHKKKDIEGALAAIPLLTLEELVPLAKRPKHKAGFLGMCGMEVDTIEWCTEEIGRWNREIDEQRKTLSGKTKFLDIIWHNLDDNALEMHGRTLMSWAANIGLIIGLTLLVIFIGTISNVDDLCNEVLHF
ncbi:duf221 family protein [Moniliophthora roreri]|nr:duf221 family protein [Moniliophthora roreri]